ncbi:hypothetical protein LCGC14_2222480, partial [marine sediment metagenome]
DDDILKLADTGELFFHSLSWFFGLIAFFLISATIINIYVASILIILPIVMFWFLWGPRTKSDLNYIYEKVKWFLKHYKSGPGL